MKTTSKMEGTKKRDDDLRNEEGIKNEDDNLRNWPPPRPLKNYLKFLLMTSHRDIHTKIDVNLEVIPGIQTGNGIPHDKCNLRGIAQCPCTHKQKRRHFQFSCKDDCILTKHTWRWTYPALRYFFFWMSRKNAIAYLGPLLDMRFS